MERSDIRDLLDFRAYLVRASGLTACMHRSRITPGVPAPPASRSQFTHYTQRSTNTVYHGRHVIFELHVYLLGFLLSETSHDVSAVNDGEDSAALRLSSVKDGYLFLKESSHIGACES